MDNIRFYKKNFLTSGIVSYNDIDDGVLLLKKETIDKALNTFKDKPVIITHDGTESVGKVIDCYYDADTANYICIFYVDNPEAIDLLDNQGQSISCTYDCLDYGDSGTYHNIPYDKEAKNISFVNLAIVEKPRYQEAKEYINGLENGGKGSGNWGHKGRKGQVGGSGKGGNDKERVKYGARLGMLNKASKKNKNKKDLLKKVDKVKEIKNKNKSNNNNKVFDIIIENISRIKYLAGDRLLQYLNLKKEDIKPEQLLNRSEEYKKTLTENFNKTKEIIEAYKKSDDFNKTYDKVIKDLEAAKKEAVENPKEENFIKQGALYDLYNAAKNGRYGDDFNTISNKLIKEKKEYLQEQKQELDEAIDNVIKNKTFNNERVEIDIKETGQTEKPTCKNKKDKTKHNKEIKGVLVKIRNKNNRI